MKKAKFKEGDKVKIKGGPELFQIVRDAGRVAYGKGPWIRTYAIQLLRKDGNPDNRSVGSAKYRFHSEDETNLEFASLSPSPVVEQTKQ